MARKIRQLSFSGYYHIMIRGVNRQDIFCDDEDRNKMLDCLEKYRVKSLILKNIY